MNLNLKLIQTFLAVAELRSFRRAAEALHRTTSAVSMQVRQLEDQVGTALFQRTTRQVELTLEGRHLLDCARRAMTDLDAGLHQLKDAIRLRAGVVTVASSPTIAAALLPRVLAAFRVDYPRVTVRVRELGAQDILGAVRQREVDLGIGPTHGGLTADLQVQALLRDELCALVPLSHPLARRRNLALEQLADIPMVMLGHFAAIRQVVENAAAEAGVTLSVQYEAQQMQTLVAMASAGLGVAVSTRLAAASFPSLPHLKVLGLGVPALVRDIGLITPRGLSLTPMAAELSKRIRAAV